MLIYSYRYSEEKMSNHIVSGVVPPQTFKQIKKFVKEGKFKNVSCAVCEILNFALLKMKDGN